MLFSAEYGGFGLWRERLGGRVIARSRSLDPERAHPRGERAGIHPEKFSGGACSRNLPTSVLQRSHDVLVLDSRQIIRLHDLRGSGGIRFELRHSCGIGIREVRLQGLRSREAAPLLQDYRLHFAALECCPPLVSLQRFGVFLRKANL
jgi:hypothetical protein